MGVEAKKGTLAADIRAARDIGKIVFYWSKIEREITYHIQRIEVAQSGGFLPRLDGSYRGSWPPEHAKFERRFKVRLKYWRRIVLCTLENGQKHIERLYSDILEINLIRDNIIHNSVNVQIDDSRDYILLTTEYGDLASGYSWIYENGPMPKNAGLPALNSYTEEQIRSCVASIFATGHRLRTTIDQIIGPS